MINKEIILIIISDYWGVEYLLIKFKLILKKEKKIQRRKKKFSRYTIALRRQNVQKISQSTRKYTNIKVQNNAGLLSLTYIKYIN